MVKYRFLTDEELKGFEEEFKHFLIANGLHAEEWEKMNSENPDKAIEIVGLFSDLILDKVYDKTNYILHTSPKALKAFKFNKENAVLIGVDYKGEGELPEAGVIEFIANNAADMLIYGTSKSFSEENRNKELHFLVKHGAVVTDEKVFEYLAEIKGKQ